jgi:hypothetical protein
MNKHFITAQELLEDSFKLGLQVVENGFDPKFIVGVWRGGAPIGVAVQELLDFYGVETDHIAIRTSSYIGMRQQKEVKVHGLEYVVANIKPEDQLLIVDDVFDTGRSVEALLRELKARCQDNTPKEIKIATVYFKPSKNQTDISPDFYVYKTDDWLVFPHELKGLTHDEIKTKKGFDFPKKLGRHSLKEGDQDG